MSVPTDMRALVLTKAVGASQPSLALSTSHPVPVPRRGELLVRIEASAIQPSDVFNARGGFGSTTFPRIPGRDWAGTVVAVGEDDGGHDDELRPGTAVFGGSGSTRGFTVDGFHAEYAVVSAAAVARRPASVSAVQAATAGVPLTTAALVMERAQVRRGETVLVLGAHGAVGSAMCAMLEQRGCTVLRGVRGPHGDVDTEADPELRTVGGGVDAVLDTVGLPAMTAAAVDTVLGRGGRLVFIVAPKGGDEAPRLTVRMRDFYRLEKSIAGVNSAAHDDATMGRVLRQLCDSPLLGDGCYWGCSAETAAAAAAAKTTTTTTGEGNEERRGMRGWDEVSLEEAVERYASGDTGRKSVIRMV